MIRSMQYSVAFSGLNLDEKDCRRAVEDCLVDFKFSILNMPMQAPPEIVRMSGFTENNHSTLNLSNVRADLFIQYDEEYSNDSKNCFSYGHEKAVKVIEALEKQNVNVEYIGVVVQYSIDNDAPVEAIKQHLVKIEDTNMKVFNLGVKFTLVYEEMYYVNVDITNWRLRNTVVEENPQVLGVVVDVNNRYGMENKAVDTNISILNQIEKLQQSVTEFKINEFLTTGRLKLNGEK